MAFRYESLNVWPLALEYVDACFVVADGLPQKAQFSIGEQLRRAATSIIANIAEGAGKAISRSERNFYDIARGSLAETVGLLALCQRRKYVTDDQHSSLYNRANVISSMLWGLIKANDDKKTREESARYDLNDHSLDGFFVASPPVASPLAAPPPAASPLAASPHKE